MVAHPGFKCPLDEDESYDDYELRFDQREAAELCTAVPSTGLIDVEHRSKNPMIGQNLPLTHELFDFAETIFDVLDSRVVTLTKKTEDKGVRLTFPDMPYLIVWSKPEGDFVAVEPWGRPVHLLRRGRYSGAQAWLPGCQAGGDRHSRF